MHHEQKEYATYLLHTSGRWKYLRVERCSIGEYVPVSQKSARVVFLARRAEQSADLPRPDAVPLLIHLLHFLFPSSKTSRYAAFVADFVRFRYFFSPLVCIMLRVFDIRRSSPVLFYQTGRIFGDLRDLAISERTARSFLGSTDQHISEILN